jgi:hypothetical protein
MDSVHEPWTTQAPGPWWTSRCSGGVTTPEHMPAGDCSHWCLTRVASKGKGRLAKLLAVSARCGVVRDEPMTKRGKR